MWSDYPEIAEELKAVEDFIRRNMHSRNRLLSEIAMDLLEAGGKRLRPAFVIISSKFGKYDREKTIPLAGALEILHTATLVHDDIIDRSKIRRGKATVSEKFGADMAVYTGDFLLTKAVLMLSRNISIEKLEYVAKAVKTICEGEVDQYLDACNLDTTVMSYLKRISRKTAVLFGAACALGAMAAECSDNSIRNLARFGFNYGIAFQIKDDINDFLSDTAVSGKPVGSDLMNGIITLPVIYAVNRSSAVRKLVAELFRNKDAAASRDISHITWLIEKHGGMDYSRKILRKYIDKGLKLLGRLPDNEYRDLFSKLITRLGI